MTEFIRPSRDEINLEICGVIKKRSECRRGNVGCVITQNNRIVSTGYNNPVGGHLHCISECDVENKCQHSVHAESNAIAFAAKYGIPLQAATLYCSTQPCLKCSELIIQAGIIKVVYQNKYTDDLGTNLLIKNGVEVICHY